MSPRYKYQANVTHPFPSNTYSGYILSDLLPGRTRIDMPSRNDPTRKTRLWNSQHTYRNLPLQSLYHEIILFFQRKEIQTCKSALLPGSFPSIGRMVVHFSIQLSDRFLSPANSSMEPISDTGSFGLLVQHSH